MKKRIKSKKRVIGKTSAGSVVWSSLNAKKEKKSPINVYEVNTGRTLTDTSMCVSDEESQMMLAYHLTLAALLMSQFSGPQANAVAARVGRFLDGDAKCAEAEAAREFVGYLDRYYERMKKEDEA